MTLSLDMQRQKHSEAMALDSGQRPVTRDQVQGIKCYDEEGRNLDIDPGIKTYIGQPQSIIALGYMIY